MGKGASCRLDRSRARLGLFRPPTLAGLGDAVAVAIVRGVARAGKLVTDNLYAPHRPWTSTDWTDSDDRVRGGASHSYMQCSPLDPIARFCGNLDTSALGGAGFASQRTTREEAWDLSESDGIEIVTAGSDGAFALLHAGDLGQTDMARQTSATP